MKRYKKHPGKKRLANLRAFMNAAALTGATIKSIQFTEKSNRKEVKKMTDNNMNIVPEEIANEFSLATAPAGSAPAPMAIETNDDGAQMILDLTTRRTSYCSLTANSVEEKAVLYNAMNAPDARLKEHINEVIRLKNIFVEVVYCLNKATGAIEPAPRIVLIDDNGTSFQCVSKGIFGAVKKLFAVYGEPQNWGEPIPVKVKQIILSADRNVLTLEVVKAE